MKNNYNMRIQIHTDNSSRLEKELRQYPTLSGEENLDLLKQYKLSGDTKLREQLFKGNTRLIWLVANQYIGLFGYSKEELFSIGSISLLNAIDNYRLDAGYMFSPYAKMAIINGFNNEVAANGSLIRIKSRTIKEGKEHQFNFISTTAPIGDGEGTLIEDILVGDETTFDDDIDADDTKQRVDAFWNLIRDLNLKEEHYDICKAIWSATTETGKPIKITSTEVAEMYGCSKQNIQFKKKAIIKRLKQNPTLYQYWKNGYMNYD